MVFEDTGETYLGFHFQTLVFTKEVMDQLKECGVYEILSRDYNLVEALPLTIPSLSEWGEDHKRLLDRVDENKFTCHGKPKKSNKFF